MHKLTVAQFEGMNALGSASVENVIRSGNNVQFAQALCGVELCHIYGGG
jgi:hypothetical protein